jgi:hypothetical protein
MQKNAAEFSDMFSFTMHIKKRSFFCYAKFIRKEIKSDGDYERGKK